MKEAVEGGIRRGILGISGGKRGEVGFYFGRNWTLHEENEAEKYLRRGTTQG